jgi:hypothetical protein
MKSRAFVIYYQAVYQENVFVGTHAYVSDEYPNQTDIVDLIMDEHGFDDLAITGVQELSIQDFLDWTK